MSQQPLVLERTYDAPVETVWKALTDLPSLRQWYFNVDDFRPEVGFRFRFAGQGKEGQAYMHSCQVTHVVPLRARISDDGTKVLVLGNAMAQSYKYRQVQKNPWVAVVWDGHIRTPSE